MSITFEIWGTAAPWAGLADRLRGAPAAEAALPGFVRETAIAPISYLPSSPDEAISATLIAALCRAAVCAASGHVIPAVPPGGMPSAFPASIKLPITRKQVCRLPTIYLAPAGATMAGAEALPLAAIPVARMIGKTVFVVW